MSGGFSKRLRNSRRNTLKLSRSSAKSTRYIHLLVDEFVIILANPIFVSVLTQRCVASADTGVKQRLFKEALQLFHCTRILK